MLSACASRGLIHSGTEDAGAHPYHGGAAFYGNLIVVTHAPRAFFELRAVGKIPLFHLVKEPGGGQHLLSYLPFIVYIRGHHHQSVYADALQVAPFACFEQLAARIQRQAILGFLLGNVQFEQRQVSPGCSSKPAC